MTASAPRCFGPRVLGIANALAYCLNALETFGVGPFSHAFSSDQDNASISQKYQTIITPNGVAFSIWGVIFLGEAACVSSTLFSERCRTHPLIVVGVSYWFVAVCLAQTAWSPAFAYEMIPLSAAFMSCILLALMAIVVRQYNVVTKALELETTNALVPKGGYWLLQFPFELHLGWIIAAFTLNLNILAVAGGGDAKAQEIAAFVSLVMLTIVSVACLWLLKRPQYTIPSVAAWATFWMGVELRNPKSSITETFTEESIRSFMLLTFSLSGILASVTVVRWVCHRHSRTSTGDDGVAKGESLLS